MINNTNTRCKELDESELKMKKEHSSLGIRRPYLQYEGELDRKKSQQAWRK